jgi:acyl-CoA synthetase (AMP-forming)/AMP-acid ligase II
MASFAEKNLVLDDLLRGGDARKLAVVVPGGPRVTYGELAERVELLAARLGSAGLEPGAAVSLVLGNDLWFAVTRAGLTAAPLNPAYTEDEFGWYLEAAGARAVVVPPGESPAIGAAKALGVPVLVAEPRPRGIAMSQDGRVLPAIAPPARPDASATALLLHTSGTTSRPKAVPLTHANIVVSAGNTVRTYALGPGDVALGVMPLFHVHGLIGVCLSTLASGGTVALPPRFSASVFWEMAKACGATWHSAAPAIHQVLLLRAEQDKAPKGTFRFIRSCSSALAPALLEQMEARFGSPVLEAYGMTEAAHQIASNPLPPGERRPGSVGVGTGVETGVMDEAGRLLAAGKTGEVVIRGPNVTPGYRDNPEANKASFANGWLRTGDQGVIEPGGYVRLTGRIKELINRGGEKISPLEVDAVLARHPAVAEAVSFGVPDTKYGEEVHAAVVLKGSATPADLQRFCAGRLAEFKVPKVIHVVETLPKTATGKVQRRQVAQAVGKG